MQHLPNILSLFCQLGPKRFPSYAKRVCFYSEAPPGLTAAPPGLSNEPPGLQIEEISEHQDSSDDEDREYT